MAEKSMSHRLLLLVSSVGLAGVGCVWLLLSSHPLRVSGVVFLLAATVVVSEVFPVRLPSGGTVSVSYPAVVAALILAGPGAALLNLTLAGAVGDLASRKPPLRLAYNVAQFAVATSLAGLAYAGLSTALGIPVPVGESLGRVHFPSLLLPVAAFSAILVLVNATLVSAAVALSSGLSIQRIWRTGFASNAATQMALALLGVALAQAIALESWFGLFLFVIPLAVARGVFQGYVRLSEVYADTVRGLIAAIEAKDPYTRGHSERVASYAVRIAEAMRVPESKLEQLELAALLHDLGKVGVVHQILAKRGRLTDEEMRTVREHPRIGAEIISEIPFLQPSLPAIAHHHERYDGGGYTDGLEGQTIPLEARILAVADSYDAMTSNRPYKRVMSHREALDEVRVQAGRQFDPHVVAAFLASEPEPSGDAGGAEAT